MADEKRVKLGVDIGELSNQLVQINNVIEQNYKKALQGQSEYNKILEESLQLLQRQVDLVGQLGQQNQMGSSISAPQSEPIGGGEDDKSSKLNEVIERIFADVDGIWEKFSALTTPIPVEVVNTPLKIEADGGGVSGSNGGNGGNGGNGQQNQGKQGQGSSQQKGGSALGMASNLAANSVPDPNYLIAGFAAMIPVVGAGMSSVISKMIGEAEQRIRAEAIFHGAVGYDKAAERYYKQFESLHHLGLKDTEAYQKVAQYYPANIKLDIKDFEFEKGYNVSSGTMSSLLRAMREDKIQDKFKYSSSELGVNYLTMLSMFGNIDKQKVRGYTEDYLKILIDLNQQQLETTGETNSLINSQVVANIAKLSDKFGDPTVLSRVISGIKGGLINAPSPQAEALQYWAMSQANPEADLWKMRLMKEAPFDEESRGYLSNYIEALLQTGNANDVRFNLLGAFEQYGVTAHDIENLVNGIAIAKEDAEKENKSFNLTEYLEGYDWRNLRTFGNTAAQQIETQAGAATAKNEVLLAKTADILADLGEPILKYTNEAIEKTGEVIDRLDKFFGGRSLEEVLDDTVRKIKDHISHLGLIGGAMSTDLMDSLNNGRDSGKEFQDYVRSMKENKITPNN